MNFCAHGPQSLQAPQVSGRSVTSVDDLPYVEPPWGRLPCRWCLVRPGAVCVLLPAAPRSHGAGHVGCAARGRPSSASWALMTGLARRAWAGLVMCARPLEAARPLGQDRLGLSFGERQGASILGAHLSPGGWAGQWGPGGDCGPGH